VGATGSVKQKLRQSAHSPTSVHNGTQTAPLNLAARTVDCAIKSGTPGALLSCSCSDNSHGHGLRLSRDLGHNRHVESAAERVILKFMHIVFIHKTGHERTDK
jgi:hypothetical protein